MTPGSRRDETNSASALLQAGGSVWASTVLAFSLLYFELDGEQAALKCLYLDPSTPPAAGEPDGSPDGNQP
jgi:hypothetical protein